MSNWLLAVVRWVHLIAEVVVSIPFVAPNPFGVSDHRVAVGPGVRYLQPVATFRIVDISISVRLRFDREVTLILNYDWHTIFHVIGPSGALTTPLPGAMM